MKLLFRLTPLIPLALLMLLTACGRATPLQQADNHAYPTPMAPITNEATPIPTAPPKPAIIPVPTPEPTPQTRLIPYEAEYIPLVPRWVEGEPFLPEHLICDFEYLMHTLRYSFPLFGPAYRRHGIDASIREERTRQALIDTNTACPHTFSLLLNRHFFNYFGGFGHLGQQTSDSLHVVLANIYRIFMEPYSVYTQTAQRMHEVMRAPEAARFYGEIVVDLGEYEAGMIVPNNLATDILIEGRVAYVNVRAFWLYNLDHDRGILSAFYQEIAGFEHLIIDLRQNVGGFDQYFFELFVAPNITASLEWRILEFFSATYYNRIFADAIISDLLAADPGSVTLHYNAAHFVAENNMPYFNRNDLAMFHNAITFTRQVEPYSDERAFNGKIWVLVGPRTASAAENVAIFLRETGFATMVGQPTMGVMGAIAAYKLLPNSGIIVRYDLGKMTDRYGRSFEEFGVSPHYYNHMGMDALQTVLGIIESYSHN